MIRTGLPANFYSLFFKIIVCVILALYLLNNTFLAILLGLLVGVLLHVLTSYYDSVVELKGDIITFYYIRPIFFKEEHNLSNLDYAKIIKESPNKMMKDVWWKSDSFIPLSYSKFIMYKDDFTYEVRFHTNQYYITKLEAAIEKHYQK